MYRAELRRAHCVATPGSAHSIIGSAIATKSSPPAAAFAWTERAAQSSHQGSDGPWLAGFMHVDLGWFDVET